MPLWFHSTYRFLCAPHSGVYAACLKAGLSFIATNRECIAFGGLFFATFVTPLSVLGENKELKLALSNVASLITGHAA